MRKLLNKPWFVAVAAVAALVLVAHVVFSHGEKFGLPAFNSPPAATVDSEVSSDEGVHATTASIVANMQIPGPLRDPFAIHVKADNTEKPPEADVVDTVHLSAIWTQDGHTLVLINDRICEGGDEIGHLKIESATRDGVWISHWKGRNFVSIGGNFTLNTPASKFLRAVSSL